MSNTISEQAAVEAAAAVTEAEAKSVESAKAEQPAKAAPKTKAKAKAAEKPKYATRKRMEPHTLVSVINGTAGKLVFRSPKSGELFVWDKFGDELEIEFQDLQAAKGKEKAFYENNWFLFVDPDVIDALGVERYYKNALHIDELDTIFTLPPTELTAKVRGLNVGQKRSLAYVARQAIEEGSLSDLNAIKALEDGLGINIIVAER